MGAKRILLVASGEDKAEAVYQTVQGPIGPQCPASVLRLHRDAVLVVDEAAFSKLAAAGVKP